MNDKVEKILNKLTSKEIGEILSAEINGTKESLYEKGSLFSGVKRFNRTLTHDEMSELFDTVINDYLAKHGEVGKYIITLGEWTSIIEGEYFTTVEEAQRRAMEIAPRIQRKVKNNWLTIRDRITGEPVCTSYIAKMYHKREWVS